MQTAMRPDPADDVPPPVLFNPWKHHAGAIRRGIGAVVALGPAALEELARQLFVVGTELMDLYTGPLPPVEIAAGILARLRVGNLLDPGAYRAWLDRDRGYRVLALPADGSAWVLRFGEEGGRHVHVHPGRGTPHTCRVRANVLKTAVLAVAGAAVEGGQPLDVDLINRLRRDHLALSPIRALAEEGGLRAVIQLLR
jgi:hypothetical protein